MHGDISQDLAVDGDAGLAQPIDQTAVGQPEHARGSVDAHDPQCTELALALLAADIGVLTGLDDGLVGNAEDLAAGVVVALGAADDFLVTTTGGDATLYTSHGRSPALEVRQHASHTLGVARLDVVGGTETALTLGRLLGQDVRLERVACLELAGSGLAKTLRRRPVGLDLGHGNAP